MNKSLEYFDIDLPINDKRDILGVKLNNGINIVLVSDPDSKTSSCSIGVKAGYLQDKFEGTAHFLEHLLFMGSSKFPEQNTYHSYIQMCGGIDNAFTGDNITCFFLDLESEFMEKGIEMLSWFFREPLLDMKHINSEMEIINSEHQKNILSDMWVMDDIFKKFIEKSKYSNFGTGNSSSLKDITKEDIMDFYNTYYTTDNIFACIVDTKPINFMRKNYLKYFEDIEEKKYTGTLDRFQKDKLNLIDDNIIVFKSISQYNFLNFYIRFNCEQRNQLDYQLINLISELIGSEYTKSFSYFLKENNIANFIKTNVDYYYDYDAVISINITLIEKSVSNIDKICIYLNSLLNKLSTVDTREFVKIYDNFRKINLLHSLYRNKMNASDVSNNIIENLINGENSLCVIRKNTVPEYNLNIYKRYVELLTDIDIKITSNLNINKHKENKFLESDHYKTKYYLSNYECKSINAKIDYDINNITLFADITIKSDIISSSVNKKLLPDLIYKNEVREVYLLEHNKYEKPIMNITVIRKNPEIISKNNNLIVTIYNNMCSRILNYYLDTISNYKMYFSMSVSDEYLILNFNGLDYVMNKFVNDIVNKTSYYSVETNPASTKYFEEIKHEIKESLLNLKYNSPYTLCLKYFSVILSNDFMPDEAIAFIDNLTYESFMQQLDKLLFFEKEYFIIVGNLKNCPEAFACDDSTIKNAMNYVDIITLNVLRYKTSATKLTAVYDDAHDLSNSQSNSKANNTEESSIYQEFNYTLSQTQINSKEVNNCLIDCYLIKKYKLEILNDTIKIQQLKIIFRDRLICTLISDLINEPLFDKIRTIDKLGYIVKSTLKYHTYLDNAVIFLCYIIQSNYTIDDIYKSVNDFNTIFYEDFKTNKDKFKIMFETLKKSKLLDLKKNPADLDEEVMIYLSSIINKYSIFNYDKLNAEILETITFKEVTECVENLFTSIVKTNRYHVILNKDI
jgi:insulysin